MRARTDDGRKRAKARGVRFGRPRKLDQHQRQEALERLAKGETLVDVARTFGVDPTTIGQLQSPFVLGDAAARGRRVDAVDRREAGASNLFVRMANRQNDCTD